MTLPQPKPGVLTTLTAIMAGAALMAIAANGLSAAPLHAMHGNASSAALTFLIATVCALTALLFWLPSARRRILAATASRDGRGLVTLCCAVALTAILIAAAVATRVPASVIYGVIPKGLILPAAASFAVLFTVVFILPGLAYRPYHPRLPAAPAVAGPPSKIDWDVRRLRSPALRLAVRALVLGYLALLALAFYAWQFAAVIPDADILGWNRRWVSVTIAVATLPFAMLVAKARLSGGAVDRASHLRAKVPVILGLLLFNGLLAVMLPERVLPLVTNALSNRPESARSYLITEAKARSGLRGCGARIVVHVAGPDSRTYGLCRMPADLSSRAEPGDTLLLFGRDGRFGMTYSRVALAAKGQ